MGRKPTKKKGKKIKRPPWPEDKTNKLIENYEEETVLYVKSARGYSNRDLREATYKKIGEKFDVTGEEIEARLTTLRTRFGRIRRDEIKARMKSGSAPLEQPDEVKDFMKKMGFLHKHVQPRGTKDSLNREDEDGSDEDGDRHGSQHGGSEVDQNDEDMQDGDGGMIEEGASIGGGDEEPMAIEGLNNQDTDILEKVVMGQEDLNMDVGGAGDQANMVDNIPSPEDPDMENTELGRWHDPATKPASEVQPSVSGSKAMNPVVLDDDEDENWPTKSQMGEFEGRQKEIQKSAYKPSGSPRSPTPPAMDMGSSQTNEQDKTIPKTAPLVPRKTANTNPDSTSKRNVPKKGIGKNTVRQPSTTSKVTSKKTPMKTPNKSSSQTSNRTKGNIDEPVPGSSTDTERLSVLKNINATLQKDIQDDDEYFHWGSGLGYKIKRVPFPRLREHSVGTINAIVSDAVMGERHPALDLVYPPKRTADTTMTSVPITLPTHQSHPQSYYIAAPTMPHQPPLFQTVQPPANQSQQRIIPTTATSDATVSGAQAQPTQVASQATQSQQVDPGSLHPHVNIQLPHPYNQFTSAADYAAYLSQSPLKGLAPVRCHTVTNYGSNPSATTTLDFTQL